MFGHDRRGETEARKDFAQKSRWNDDAGGASGRRTNQPDLAPEKALRVPTPIVDHDRHAAKHANPDRRCCEQVPGPSGVGHHVHQVRLCRGAPDLRDERQQSEQRTNAAQTRDPARPIVGVVADYRDIATFLAQQGGELLRLVRHSSGRRRQRTDQHDRTRNRPIRLRVRCFRRQRAHVAARCVEVDRLRIMRTANRAGVRSQGVKRGNSKSESPTAAAPDEVVNAASNPRSLTISTCSRR